MNYLRVYESVCGGLVELHPLHGADELPDNSEAACVLADNAYIIQLLPSFPESETGSRQEWLWDVAERKNPDVRTLHHL